MSVGVDKPWPRLVARLRAAALDSTHWPAIALLSDAADALEAAAKDIAYHKVLVGYTEDRAEAAEARAIELEVALDREVAQRRLNEQAITQWSMQAKEAFKNFRAAEARAEEAIQWIGVVRDELVIAGFPGGDRDVALANIRTLLTGRRVIAENAGG